MIYLMLAVIYLAVSLFTVKINYGYNSKRITLCSGDYERACDPHGAIWTSFVPVVGQVYAIYQVIDYNIYSDGFDINAKIFREKRSDKISKRHEFYESMRAEKIARLERSLDRARAE